MNLRDSYKLYKRVDTEGFNSIASNTLAQVCSDGCLLLLSDTCIDWFITLLGNLGCYRFTLQLYTFRLKILDLTVFHSVRWVEAQWVQNSLSKV